MAHARRFLEWLFGMPRTETAAPKYPTMLSAWYWNGGTSIGAQVKEITYSGAHLYTPETWYPGTILTVTLQCGSGKNGAKSADFLTVPCKVTGHEQDGIRVIFMCAGSEERKALQRFIERVPCRETPLPPRRERGRSLVEFGLIVQIVILLIIKAVNCSGFIYDWANHKTGDRDSRYRRQAHRAGAPLRARGRTNRSGLAEK